MDGSDLQLTNPTEIYEDNLACVAMSENPMCRKFSRHIDIRRYFVRELVKAGFVKLHSPSYTQKGGRRSRQESTFARPHQPPTWWAKDLLLWSLCTLNVFILPFVFIFFNDFSRFTFFWMAQCVLYMPTWWMGKSDISSIDHLIIRKFVTGPPIYCLTPRPQASIHS